MYTWLTAITNRWYNDIHCQNPLLRELRISIEGTRKIRWIRVFPEDEPVSTNFFLCVGLPGMRIGCLLAWEASPNQGLTHPTAGRWGAFFSGKLGKEPIFTAEVNWQNDSSKPTETNRNLPSILVPGVDRRTFPLKRPAPFAPSLGSPWIENRPMFLAIELWIDALLTSATAVGSDTYSGCGQMYLHMSTCQRFCVYII